MDSSSKWSMLDKIRFIQESQWQCCNLLPKYRRFTLPGSSGCSDNLLSEITFTVCSRKKARSGKLCMQSQWIDANREKIWQSSGNWHLHPSWKFFNLSKKNCVYPWVSMRISVLNVQTLEEYGLEKNKMNNLGFKGAPENRQTLTWTQIYTNHWSVKGKSG